MPSALQQLASPPSSASSTGSTPSLASLGSSLSTVNPVLSSTSRIGWISSALLSNANQVKSLMPGISAATDTASGSGLASGLGPGALGSFGSAGLSGAAGSAGVSCAAAVGALSVPQTWVAAAPTVSPAAATLPEISSGAAPAATGSDPPSLLGAPLAGTAERTGGNMGNTVGPDPPVHAPPDGGTTSDHRLTASAAPGFPLSRKSRGRLDPANRRTRQADVSVGTGKCVAESRERVGADESGRALWIYR
jgi:hypothetical protein